MNREEAMHVLNTLIDTDETVLTADISKLRDYVIKLHDQQRLEIAKAAMQGMLARGALHRDDIPNKAVEQADALLAELAKPKGQPNGT